MIWIITFDFLSADIVNNYLSYTENSSGFFTDYRKHSQDIVEIIKNGFGRDSCILGRCIYSPFNGVSIEFPKLIKLKDIGLAEHHIQYGYPDIWTIKCNAESECNKILKDIQSTYAKVEQMILSIDKNIIQRDIKLERKFNGYRPKYTHFQSFYEDNIIIEVFNEITNHIIKSLLFQIADEKDAAGDVASAIVWNFNELPPNVQSLLFKLADNKDSTWDVAHAVASYFNELPPNVQSLLFKLADNKDTAEDISRAVADNFEKIPENTRNELHKRLAKYGYNIG